MEHAVKVLVLGATGLLGNAVFRSLSKMPGAQVTGTIRQEAARGLFDARTRRVSPQSRTSRSEPAGAAVRDAASGYGGQLHCRRQAGARRSDAVTCGLLGAAAALVPSLPALRRAADPDQLRRRFSGGRGSYSEDDLPDADDVYGMSKLLGEIVEPHAITLRTSIIGHELQSGTGLLEWFLSQQGECRCYTRAIFSGFPTIVLADLIRDVVIPRPDLHGIYHVATRPISKFDLLRLVAERYGKKIKLIADDRSAPNRSLVAERFRAGDRLSCPGLAHAGRCDVS